VPGTPTTRSPAPSRKAISAVSAVRQTMRRGKSARLDPYIPELSGRRSGGARRPRPRDAGVVAEQKPSGKGTHELARSVEANISRSHRLLQRDVAEPDPRERGEIRRHDEIDPEPGVLQADVHLTAAGDEPGGRRAATARHATKIESRDDTPIREPIHRQATTYVPQEQACVEILGRGATVNPALPPRAELLDHSVKLGAGLAQSVLAPAPRGMALDDADILQVAQALGQKRP